MRSDRSAHAARRDAACCREVMRRGPDDARARELATTLYVHEIALAAGRLS
jgi:hypothetical protein